MKQIFLLLVLTGFMHQAAISQQSIMESQSGFEIKSIAQDESANRPRFIHFSNFSSSSSKRWSYDALKDSIPSPNNTQLSEQYFTKGNDLQTIGFVLLGVGIAAGIGGAISTINSYDPLDGSGYQYVILFALGVSSAITSIPLIAIGSHYKRKAKLLLHNENISHAYRVPIKSNIYSAGISISLR